LKVIKIFTLAVLLALTACKSTPPVTTPAPTPKPASRDIYPAPEQAKDDLAAALKTAVAQHKRVIVDFGGNWCGDCKMLDIYFHDANNRPILEANFVLTHVNIGTTGISDNFDLAEKFGIPLHKGVPALAVLDERGKLLYSQKSGEFESMRHMESSAVTAFLNRWKR